MSKLISLTLVLFFSFFVQGQNKAFTAKLTATYDMYLNFGHIQRYASTLHIGNSEAFFTYKWQHSNEKAPSSSTPEVLISDTTTSKIITTVDSVYSVVTNIEGGKYLLKEKKPKLNWQLSTETKTIANTLCQLATTTFRGRSYQAWYAPSIPVKYGPYKFNGLPGLILKISDSDNEVIFTATKISYTKQEIVTNIDSQLKVITLEQYLKLINEQKQKFAAKLKRIQSRFPKGTAVSVDKVNVKSIERDFNVKASK